MRRKVDREHIVEKGLELMYCNGFEATGIKEIADAAGMLKGSFYNYFSSKEEFARVLIETYGEQTYTLSREFLENKSMSPVARIRKMYQHTWDSVSREGYCRGCFLGNCSQEIGITIPFLSAAVAAEWRRIKDLHVACLQEAKALGEIPQHLDPEMLSEFIINSWQGTLLRAKSAKGEEPVESFFELVFNQLLK